MKTIPRALLPIAALAAGCGPAPDIEPVAPPAGESAPRSHGDAPTLSAAERYLKVPLYGDGFVDDSGYELAARYTGPVADRGDLRQVADAIRHRNRRGIADLEATLARVDPSSPDAPQLLATFQYKIALLFMYEGAFDEADRWLERAAGSASDPLVPVGLRENIGALRGVAALRRGETENCVACLGPSSCILPIAPEAVHRFPDGAAAAVDHLSNYVRSNPEDLGVRWVLNIAFATLGVGRDEIPSDLYLPTVLDAPAKSIGRFENVAAEAGLISRGPDMAGGAVFDDFDGDGLPDLFWTSYDADHGPSFFVNNGDGSFRDATARAGLDDQVLAVNCVQADYDNDERLDVLLLRGGWESPAPLSLLRNLGDGRFADVTNDAGLGRPIASQSAAFADYDLDGDLDLYVCGELPGTGIDAGTLFVDPDDLTGDADDRLCRLYRNEGDRTFTDVTESAGVSNARYAKGCSWGDYDEDGDPDLYVSNMNGPNRLYRNMGDGSFADVAPELGVERPLNSFACWWFDFDNDGRLDLFATEYSAGLDEYVASRLGPRYDPTGGPWSGFHQRLYRNLGPGGFVEVGASSGLDRAALPMGAGFGDLDGDGFLDVYLATGRPGYSYLVPNVLYRNVEGSRFVDVTAASGTGHLQKGHGTAFADHDRDGDLDLFVELGGAVPGDASFNALFRNPGHGHRSLTIRLVGTRSNRSALGARVRVDLRDPDGTTRTIHRLVSNSSSFGGSSFEQVIGLGDLEAISSVTIRWPIPGSTPQVLADVPLDARITVVEGDRNPIREHQ